MSTIALPQPHGHFFGAAIVRAFSLRRLAQASDSRLAARAPVRAPALVGYLLLRRAQPETSYLERPVGS